METGKTQQTPEAKTQVERQPLSEGSFLFENKNKERGKALIVNENEKLETIMTAPMEFSFLGGERKVVKRPDGSEEEVLEIQAFGLSPEGTQGAALMHLQLDRYTLTTLLGKAAESAMLPKVESKWAPGGKMEQLTRFGLRIDKELGE